jgi:NAD(P)H-dependent FMN reductase
MIKLLFLSGSIRQQSFNKKLALLAAKYCQLNTDIEATFIYLKDYPMPIYNGEDEDKNGLPDNAILLKKQFSEADGFFISSPEYNSSISALLKNTLDWISRSHKDNETPLIAFKDKVCAISSTSPGGLGGLRGLITLRMILGNIGVHVLPSQVSIGSAFKAFDENNNLVNDNQKEMLENVLDQFMSTCKKLSN